MSIHLPPKRFEPRPRRRERRLIVDFACNDEHGAFSGRAVAAHSRPIEWLLNKRRFYCEQCAPDEELR